MDTILRKRSESYVVRVTVFFDSDGTQQDEFIGYRISSQIFSGTTNAVVCVFNESNEITKIVQYSHVYRIVKVFN